MRREWPSWRCILRKSGKISKQHFPALFPEPFRMPLDAEQRQVRVEQAFDHIVSGAAGAEKPLAQMIHCLMVGGIDQCAAAIELIKEVIAVKRAVIDIVCLVFAGPFMAVGGIDMLFDGSPKMYIDDLKALADAQHGLFLFYKEGERLELQDIQFRINLAGAMVCLAEECGGDITAAGKEQMGG